MPLPPCEYNPISEYQLLTLWGLSVGAGMVCYYIEVGCFDNVIYEYTERHVTPVLSHNIWVEVPKSKTTQHVKNILRKFSTSLDLPCH